MDKTYYKTTITGNPGIHTWNFGKGSHAQIVTAYSVRTINRLAAPNLSAEARWLSGIPMASLSPLGACVIKMLVRNIL